jgi:hypothetical protein
MNIPPAASLVVAGDNSFKAIEANLIMREIKPQGNASATRLGDYRSMDRSTKLDDEIETAEQHETFKQMLLRVLDDPQIQQKIGNFLRRSGLAGSTRMNVPQRWSR